MSMKIGRETTSLYQEAKDKSQFAKFFLASPEEQ